MEWGQYRCEGMEWNGDNSEVGNGMGTIQVGSGMEWGQYRWGVE